MQLFLYEWITGGGLIDHHGPLPDSLLRQGKAMVEALAEDASRIESLNAVMLRDIRVHSLVGRGAEIIDIDSHTSHHAEFDRLATESDLTIIIAPETDNVLFELAKRAEGLEARLASPSSQVIKLAGNKQKTAERLAETGVPIPHGVELHSEQPLPEDFVYPAVLKPVLGAGSEDTVVVNNHHDIPPAYAWPRRLETFVPGKAVSAAFLCSPSGKHVALPPSEQRLTSDEHLHYLGGELPLPRGLANRATDLASRAIRVLDKPTGYVGVDLVLGNDPDGKQDYVIEINPRLSTSYIGLRHAVERNLLQLMINQTQASVLKETISIRNLDRRLTFDADGSVYDSE